MGTAVPTRKRVFLAAFLLLPIFLVGALVWFIAWSAPRGLEFQVPAIGARHYPGAAGRAPLVPPESLAEGFVLVVTDKSGKGSAARPIYLASNHNGWNPGDPKQRLEPQSDSRWRITIPKPVKSEPLEFKFTLGSWEQVEQDATGNDIANRTLPRIDARGLTPGQPVVIELTIETFREGNGASTSRYRPLGASVTGDVRRVQVVGGAGRAAGKIRDVLVWLPPGYEDTSNAGRRYPVLYLLDGQNVFEKHAGVPAEWRADEIAAELIASGRIEPLIIVGVPHAGPARADEYVPQIPGSPRSGSGDAFAAWLISEVVPRVERAFRVSGSAADRGIGGASLGGLMSLYAATRHPGVFGRVLAESPSLGLGGMELVGPMFGPIEAWPDRTFLGVGGREAGADREASAGYAARVRDLHGLLERRGYGERVKFSFDEGAAHSKAAWSARLPAALEFLYGAR